MLNNPAMMGPIISSSPGKEVLTVTAAEHQVVLIAKPAENLYGKVLFFARFNESGELEFAFNFSEKGLPLQDRSVLSDRKKVLDAVHYPPVAANQLFQSIVRHSELLSDSWWPLGGGNYLYAESKLYIAATSTEFGMMPLQALTTALASSGKQIPELSSFDVHKAIEYGNMVRFSGSRDSTFAIAQALQNPNHKQSSSYYTYCNPKS